MRSLIIKEYLEKFVTHISEEGIQPYIFQYECLDNFRSHWDIEALDLFNVYEKSFSSKISNRWWVADAYYPKEMMLRFLEHDRESVRVMFKDLFNEKKDIIMRMDRFRFHCDELLADLQRKNKKLDSHHHDYRMISIYLSFQYPEVYTPYDFDLFAQSMRLFEAKKIPVTDEIGRYFVLMRSLLNAFLLKADTFSDVYKNALEKESLPGNISTLHVHNFLEYCTES